MGIPRKYKPVKLIIGLIFNKEDLLYKARAHLEKKFKTADYASPIITFNYTKYYENEMGPHLMRQFLSFDRLIPAQDIYRIKLITNALEAKLALEGKRQVNIDPGYLDLAKLVLLTTKDYCHRLYLAKGIFAEVTLYFKGDTFTPLDWTYPDYRSQEHIDIFNQIRQKYYEQIK